jgi:hypothetical protein
MQLFFIYIVHYQQMHYLLNLEGLKFKLKFTQISLLHTTYFGLRPSSGSLYCTWLKLC